MKLLQRYPKRIRDALTHIENQMDYIKGTANEEFFTLQQIVLSQQAIIHNILQHVYESDGIPTEPVGVWAVNYEFDEWFRLSGDVFSDMQAGEIVILKDPCHIEYAGISASSMYKHDDKRIYVCMEDNPTSPNHFRQFDGTIQEHIEIIDNFLKG